MIGFCIRQHRQAAVDLDELVEYTIERCCCGWRPELRWDSRSISCVDSMRELTGCMLGVETIALFTLSTCIPSGPGSCCFSGIGVTFCAFSILECSTCLVCVGNICMQTLAPRGDQPSEVAPLVPVEAFPVYQSTVSAIEIASEERGSLLPST